MLSGGQLCLASTVRPHVILGTLNQILRDIYPSSVNLEIRLLSRLPTEALVKDNLPEPGTFIAFESSRHVFRLSLCEFQYSESDLLAYD